MSQSSQAFFKQNEGELDDDQVNDFIIHKKSKKNTNTRVIFGDMEVRTSNAAFSSDQFEKNKQNYKKQTDKNQKIHPQSKNIFNDDSDKSNPFDRDSKQVGFNQFDKKSDQNRNPFNRQSQKQNPFNKQLIQLTPFHQQQSNSFRKTSSYVIPQFFDSNLQKSVQNPFKKSQKLGLSSDNSQQIFVKKKDLQQNGFEGVQGHLQFSQSSSKNSNKSSITDKSIQERIRENNELIQLLGNFYDESYFMQKSRLSKVSKAKIISKNSLPTIQKLNLPYIKRKRIVFKKKQTSLQSTSNLSGNFLCRLSKKTNTIYYKQVKVDQLQNGKTSECQSFQFSDQNLDLSPNVQIDSDNMRIFCFCNKLQQVLIYGINTKEVICRIKILKKRINPILYLLAVNKINCLLILGGYKQYNNNCALQGCKYIEIYNFDKWSFNLKPKIIKLIIGRIYPIIIPIFNSNQAKLFIVGGHTNALLKKNGQIQFTQQKDINSSTNRTGVCITSKQILDFLQQQSQVKIFNNLSVQIDDPMNLYSGFAQITRNESTILLPNSKNVYRIKIINKQINIVKNQYKFYVQENVSSYHSLSLKKFKLNQHQTFIYQITEEGGLEKLEIKSKLEEQNRCRCQII